jgi:hypothetical protein
MDRTQIMWSVASLIAGWLLGWVPNWFYARRGAKELQAEAAKLRSLVKIIIDALENNGLAKISRDENGEPVSLTLQLVMKETIKTTELFPPTEVKIVDGPSRKL